MMNEYRFHLEKYRLGNRYTCPNCERKRCFTRYIDDEGEVSFPDNVGKCDHEHSCGYHYTPKDYFREHPDILSKDKLPYPTRRNIKPKIVEKPISYIANAIMERSLSHYGINPLYRYLSKVFGEQETERLMKMYHVGTSYKWGGSTIYWQVDKDDKVRTGKVMLYNPKDGHRVKEPRSYVGWAHAFLYLPDFNLCQCFFGEHLLAQHPTMSVAIVESEKTAIIASHFIHNFIWLALEVCMAVSTKSLSRYWEVGTSFYSLTLEQRTNGNQKFHCCNQFAKGLSSATFLKTMLRKNRKPKVLTLPTSY